jgi:hypothetical protein
MFSKFSLKNHWISLKFFVILFFVCKFINLGILSFLFVSLGKSLSILFILSKNQLIVSLVLCFVLLVLISWFSALIFII